MRREIAHRVVAPTLDADSDVDDGDDDAAGDAWRDVRRGHKLSVTGMALTQDDTTCYTVSKDGGIARWDIETASEDAVPPCAPAVVDPSRGGGGPMAPPKCGAATLLCCAVSQEHNLLCAAGADSASTSGTREPRRRCTSLRRTEVRYWPRDSRWHRPDVLLVHG